MVSEKRKAYATVPIGIMGNSSLALLDCISQCNSKKEGENKSTRLCAQCLFPSR